MSSFPDDLIPLGKIVKPHGIKGLIKFKPYNENSSILRKGMMVWFNKKIDDLNFKFFKISSITYNALHPIIELDQVSDRDEALALKDNILYISRSLFPETKNNDIYFVDLIGCKVYDKNEKFIGITKDIVHFPGNSHVIIIQFESKEFMIPINSDLVELFDVDEKYIVIDVVDGLVDNR